MGYENGNNIKPKQEQVLDINIVLNACNKPKNIDFKICLPTAVGVIVNIATADPAFVYSSVSLSVFVCVHNP